MFGLFAIVIALDFQVLHLCLITFRMPSQYDNILIKNISASLFISVLEVLLLVLFTTFLFFINAFILLLFSIVVIQNEFTMDDFLVDS